MTETEIIAIYNLILQYHEKYLGKFGVVLPNLRKSDGNFTKDALVLAKLAENYPDTKTVSKAELTDFMRNFYPDTVDVQQARHLAMQKGWNILSGTRGDADIPKNAYRLISLETPYPAFSQERREGFRGDFEAIKRAYNFRCATCGSKEGAEHFFRKGVKVELQQGHMNPEMPLQEGNIIPQCQICNRADRNKWIFDKTGRVIAVANSQDGIRIVKDFLRRATDETRKEILKFIQSLNGEQ